MPDTKASIKYPLKKKVQDVGIDYIILINAKSKLKYPLRLMSTMVLVKKLHQVLWKSSQTHNFACLPLEKAPHVDSYVYSIWHYVEKEPNF